MVPAPDNSPPKGHGLKARVFERVNPPAADPGAPPTVQEILRLASSGLAVSRSPATVPRDESGQAIEVRAILEANVAREASLGLDALKPLPKRRSRRLRDYLVLMIGGNGAIALLVALAGFNVVAVMFGFAGMLIVSLCGTWVMWFILSDY